MPAKTLILKPTTFSDFAAFFRFLRAEPMRALLSSGQRETIADVLDASLPADVSMEQRTPKGVTYLYIDDAFFGTVTQNGSYVAPPGEGGLASPLTRRNLARKKNLQNNA